MEAQLARWKGLVSTGGRWNKPVSSSCLRVCFDFPLLVLKGIYHYWICWMLFFFFPEG